MKKQRSLFFRRDRPRKKCNSGKPGSKSSGAGAFGWANRQWFAPLWRQQPRPDEPASPPSPPHTWRSFSQTPAEYFTVNDFFKKVCTHNREKIFLKKKKDGRDLKFSGLSRDKIICKKNSIFGEGNRFSVEDVGPRANGSRCVEIFGNGFWNFAPQNEGFPALGQNRETSQ